MTKLNSLPDVAAEMVHFFEGLQELRREMADRDRIFFENVQNKKYIDVEFKVLPDVKGELTNG